MKERVRWIDIAKFFGIFAIYLGHFGAVIGRSYYFVFSHHVALFFFISGCMEIYNAEEKFGRYFVKKIKSIMIPFWVFAALSAIVSVIHMECHWGTAKGLIVEVLRGVVRNTFVAGSLWFLTCLFVMQMIFFFIKKVKYKSLIILLSVLCYITANYFIKPGPTVIPSMYYNVDSALYYIIFYAIGYLAFPYILKLFALDTKKKQLIFGVMTLVSLGYTLGMFFGVDAFAKLRTMPVLVDVASVISPCIIIFAYFAVSRMIEDATVLADLGKNTLYLCGSEYIVRLIVENLVALAGIYITIPSPVGGYIYTGILLFVANKYLVPIEKYIINKIVR